MKLTFDFCFNWLWKIVFQKSVLSFSTLLHQPIRPNMVYEPFVPPSPVEVYFPIPQIVFFLLGLLCGPFSPPTPVEACLPFPQSACFVWFSFVLNSWPVRCFRLSTFTPFKNAKCPSFLYNIYFLFWYSVPIISYITFLISGIFFKFMSMATK